MKIKNRNLTALESAFFELSLEQSTETNRILGLQIQEAAVESRQSSGCGFFTDLVPNQDHQLVTPPLDFQIMDIYGVRGEFAAEFMMILFVKNGLILMLECVSLQNFWPSLVTGSEVSFTLTDSKRSVTRKFSVPEFADLI